MTRVKSPRPFKARYPWDDSVVDLIVLAMIAVLVVYAVWGILSAIARLP